MSERNRIIETLKHPKTTAAILLAGLAFAGCGVTKSADKIPVGPCGSHDYSEAKTGGHNTAQVLATTKRDVLALQRLALRVGGSIDLPRYGDGTDSRTVKEVTATEDNLRLSFDRSSAPASPRVDHIDFPIVGKQVFVSPGTVTCYADNHQLVVNGTYTSLQDYVHQTEALSK